MRILAIGAHPDDLEYFCGGTLAKYRQQGHQVFMTNLANGSRGSTRYGRAELAGMRLAEARAAAVIGADYLPGGFVEDLEIYPNRFLSDTIEIKKEMLRCHQSQLQFLTDYRQYDFIEHALVQSRFRGFQAGVTYAEGFRWLRLGMRGRARRVYRS